MGTEILDKIQSGTLTPGPQIGDQVKNCFEQFMPKGMKGGSGGPNGQEGDFRGPEEGPNPNGEGFKNFKGPGGCSGPEECMKYCKENPEECANFKGGQNGAPQKMPNKEEIEKMMQGGQIPEGIPEKYKNMIKEGQEMMKNNPGNFGPPQGMNIPEGFGPPPGGMMGPPQGPPSDGSGGGQPQNPPPAPPANQ
ncbi:hypothetical protein HY227_02560 [Candidatus Wolfebacteria bacterium]|nr:hypothetical protein [Candidatus Wolfebacteria bacterium]